MRQAGWRGLAALGLWVVTIGDTRATGYALRTQSATAQGNALAGATAAADDASYMFYNPATAGMLDGWQAQLSATRVAPEVRLKSSDASNALGGAIDGRSRVGDMAEDGVAPALYLVAPVGDFRIGLAATAPFALASSYPDDWAGRYHATDSEIRSVNLTPSIGWRAAPWLSLGAGLQVQYLKGRLENAIDYGTIGASFGVPGSVPSAQDGEVRLEGDDWGYGWQVGAIAEPLAGTRFGIAYRSEVNHELRGDAEFVDDDAGTAATLRALGGAFADTRAALAIDTPASLSFGLAQEVGGGVTLLADAVWTEWSNNRTLNVEFGNPAQPDSPTTQEYNDSWFFALGATWRPRDDLVLRTGVAYDQSPITDRYATPRLPDGDRYWVSLGLGWQPTSWLGIDASYAHEFVDDNEVNLAASDAGSQARGNLRARYDSHVDLFAVSARITF